MAFSILKPVEVGSGTFEKTLLDLGTQLLSGSTMPITKADRNELSNRYFGNLFASFNLPITDNQKDKFVSGIYSATAFSGFNQNRILVIEIPKDLYGESVDGKSIYCKLPVISGASSAETVIEMYSTFFDSSELRRVGNAAYSDPNQPSSEFGQNFNSDDELPGQNGLANPLSGFSSNVAYLFSDQIKRPFGLPANSWATSNGRFKNQVNGGTGTKFPALFEDNGVYSPDVPVGIAYLDKGFIVITHPAIVNNLSYSAAQNSNNTIYTGGTGFTQIHYSSSTSAITSFKSFNTEYIQNVVCMALPNEFFTSNNPSFVDKYGNVIPSNAYVRITEIGLYNSNQELIAIAKTSEPIYKNKSGTVSFNVQLKV